MSTTGAIFIEALVPLAQPLPERNTEGLFDEDSVYTVSDSQFWNSGVCQDMPTISKKAVQLKSFFV